MKYLPIPGFYREEIAEFPVIRRNVRRRRDRLGRGGAEETDGASKTSGLLGILARKSKEAASESFRCSPAEPSAFQRRFPIFSRGCESQVGLEVLEANGGGSPPEPALVLSEVLRQAQDTERSRSARARRRKREILRISLQRKWELAE